MRLTFQPHFYIILLIQKCETCITSCGCATGFMENTFYIPTLLKTYRRLFECLMFYN